VVGDLLNQFRQLGLQKEAQKTFITMADLLKQRDQVIQSVDFMVEGISPGCREKKNTSPSIPSKPPMKTTPPSKRAKFNSLVTTSISFESVQKEVILGDRDFLEERLNEEQNEQVTAMIALANADSAKEMIAAGSELTKSLSAMTRWKNWLTIAYSSSLNTGVGIGIGRIPSPRSCMKPSKIQEKAAF